MMKMTSRRVPGWMKPPRQPSAVVPHAAAMPIAKQEDRQREHDVVVREMIVSAKPRK